MNIDIQELQFYLMNIDIQVNQGVPIQSWVVDKLQQYGLRVWLQPAGQTLYAFLNGQFLKCIIYVPHVPTCTTSILVATYSIELPAIGLAFIINNCQPIAYLSLHVKWVLCILPTSVWFCHTFALVLSRAINLLHHFEI